MNRSKDNTDGENLIKLTYKIMQLQKNNPIFYELTPYGKKKLAEAMKQNEKFKKFMEH